MIDPSFVLKVLSGLSDYASNASAEKADYRAMMQGLRIEALHNLAVLDAFELRERNSADPAFLLVAKALQTTMHQAVAVKLHRHPTSEDVAHEAAVALQQRAHELQRLIDIEVQVVVDGGATERVEQEELEKDLSELKGRKSVGLCDAVTFISARVAALQSLAGLPDEVASVRKDLRGGVRLRTIQAYERAVLRGVEADMASWK